MLRTRLSDIEPTKTSHNQEKTGAKLKHLRVSGIKSYCFDIGISGASGAFLNKIVWSISVSRYDHRRKKQRYNNDN